MSTSVTQTLFVATLTESRPVPRRSTCSGPIGVRDLTRLLKDGDEGAFREFHARYFDRLFQFLLIIARGQEHEAKETLQETLLRVARRPREFSDEEAFWCWLKTVARNAARDAGRKRSRYFAMLRNFAAGHENDTTSRAMASEEALSAILADCLDELAPEDRRLLEGKYLLGATVKELAASTALSEKAVESRLGRLRARLRANLLNKLHES